MSDINRREFNKNLIKGLGISAVAATGSLSVADDVQNKIPNKPNIVFICSDQHANKYSGYMGILFYILPIWTELPGMELFLKVVIPEILYAHPAGRV